VKDSLIQVKAKKDQTEVLTLKILNSLLKNKILKIMKDQIRIVKHKVLPKVVLMRDLRAKRNKNLLKHILKKK